VQQLSDKYQEVIFYKIDAERNHDIIQSAAIQSFPTFHFYLKSNKIDELVGASETKLEVKVLQHKAQSFRKAKRSSTTPSESMDTLMALVGLSSIKEKCLSIYDTVCLIKKDESLPSDKKPDRNTVMNFLFVGNPGTGKVSLMELYVFVNDVNGNDYDETVALIYLDSMLFYAILISNLLCL
jgi:hypothetical protein